MLADQGRLQELRRVTGFQTVDWDMALDGQDPHAIGLAIKDPSTAAKDLPEQRRRAGATSARKTRGSKGFK